MAGSERRSEERIVEAVGLTKTFSDFWMRATARAVDGIDSIIAPRPGVAGDDGRPSLGPRGALWGRAAQGTALPIDEVAQAAGTVGYELMCALAPRVPVTVA